MDQYNMIVGNAAGISLTTGAMHNTILGRIAGVAFNIRFI